MAATHLDRIYKALLMIGICELLGSFGVVACGVANVAVKSRLFHIGHGIWSGIIFVLASSSAVAAGCTKSRSYLVSHLASCIVSCVFTMPGLTTMIFIEKISDSWYNYWTDSDACRNGCYTSDGEYMRVGFGPWFTGRTMTERYQCESDVWRTKCHPNTIAVTLETTILVILAMLASFFILTSSLACCILCRCRNGRDNVYPLSPSDSIIVYATYAVPNYHHAAYFSHSNMNWAMPYAPTTEMNIPGFQQQPSYEVPFQQQPPGTPAEAPPSYEESQSEQQLRQQQQQLVLQQAAHAPPPPSQEPEADKVT